MTANEEWEIIEEFPSSHYVINRKGQVKNTLTGQILKGTISQEGYLAYVITVDGKAYRRLAHVLVAKQFIPNPNNYLVVNHLDEDRANPSVDNLEWTTHSQNSVHGTAQERKGIKRSKPINEYSCDGKYIRTWKSTKAIYQYFGLENSRERRPDYFVKILNNNENPTLSKVIFAESVFIRYNGSKEDLSFKVSTHAKRNKTYEELRKAENVPSEFLYAEEFDNDEIISILERMERTYSFSPVQVQALKYAIKCVKNN